MKKWIIRISLSVLIISALVVACGILYQFISTKLDDKKYPPPGKLVDIGGYKLHINCSGKGSPVVIMDAGLGGSSLDWTSVQSGIEQFTRVCSYDRAGMGWSESSPKPRTSKVIVEELHALLKNADIIPPYILVGHSSGGINMRLYANTYPKEIFGVVFVDSSYEKQDERFSVLEERFPQPRLGFFNRVKNYILESKFANYVGITRWRFAGFVGKKTTDPKRVVKNMRVAKMSALKSLEACQGERDSWKESFKQVEQAPNTLQNKPVRVITHGKQSANASEKEKEQVKIWQTCQKDLAGLSHKCKQTFAEKSGHMINLHQPEIIVEAVREMVDEFKRT